MTKAMYIAATGANVAQRKIENESNNLANTEAAGYKRFELSAVDIHYSVDKAPGASLDGGGVKPTGLFYGIGSSVQSSYPIFTQGAARSTDNPLHIMIEGQKGFFAIQKGGETYYTRDGTFTLNRDRQLVTQQGYLVGETPITLEANKDQNLLTISGEGVVKHGDNGAIQQIQLYAFANPAGLLPIGDNLWAKTEASGEPIVGTPNNEDGFGKLRQKYLEEGNADALRSMVALVDAQKKYQYKK
jgi:flagellar basal-body rod protein FlgG